MDTDPSDAETATDLQDDLQDAEALLDDVWSLRDTPGAVVERLETHPVDEQLPFIERMPVTREGSIHWRSPVRVSVLRKQAADVQSVRRLLDRFRAVVSNAALPRSEEATNEVRSILGRIRRDLDADAVYLPALLHRLEDAVFAWLHEPPTPEALAKKEQLDALLLGVCRLEQARSHLIEEAATDPVPLAVRTRVAKRYQDQSVEHAQTYVGAPWMHIDGLTDALLAHLLTAESIAADAPANGPDERLARIAQEAHARSYDPQESMRRLRAYEEDAGFVHSLAFALLRLRRASS